MGTIVERLLLDCYTFVNNLRQTFITIKIKNAMALDIRHVPTLKEEQLTCFIIGHDDFFEYDAKTKSLVF